MKREKERKKLQIIDILSIDQFQSSDNLNLSFNAVYQLSLAYSNVLCVRYDFLPMNPIHNNTTRVIAQIDGIICLLDRYFSILFSFFHFLLLHYSYFIHSFVFRILNDIIRLNTKKELSARMCLR